MIKPQNPPLGSKQVLLPSFCIAANLCWGSGWYFGKLHLILGAFRLYSCSLVFWRCCHLVAVMRSASGWGAPGLQHMLRSGRVMPKWGGSILGGGCPWVVQLLLGKLSNCTFRLPAHPRPTSSCGAGELDLEIFTFFFSLTLGIVLWAAHHNSWYQMSNHCPRVSPLLCTWWWCPCPPHVAMRWFPLTFHTCTKRTNQVRARTVGLGKRRWVHLPEQLTLIIHALNPWVIPCPNTPGVLLCV